MALGEQPGRRRRHARRRIRPLYILISTLAAGATLIGAVYATQSASCPVALAPVADTASTTGQATHYVLTSGGGNCSYPGPPSDNLYVALSPGEYASGANCGSYLDVTGPNGTVRVKVVDQCPECAAGHIDLSATAFARLAPLGRGLIPITYRRVQNPTLPGPLSIRVKEGSSQYWLAILVIDHGNPLTRVQVATPGGTSHDLTHVSYNYWIFQSGLGSGPFAVTVTDDAGHVVKVGGVKLEPTVVQGSTVYMYGAASIPVVKPSPTPTPTPTSTPSPSAPATSPPSPSASADTAAQARAVTSRPVGCV